MEAAALASCPDGSERVASASLRGGVVRMWGWTHDPDKVVRPSTEITEGSAVACGCFLCCCNYTRYKDGRKNCCFCCCYHEWDPK